MLTPGWINVRLARARCPILAPAWILALWALVRDHAARAPSQSLHAPTAAIGAARRRRRSAVVLPAPQRLGACMLTPTGRRWCLRSAGRCSLPPLLALARRLDASRSAVIDARLRHGRTGAGLAASAAPAVGLGGEREAARRQHRRQRLVAAGRRAGRRRRGRGARGGPRAVVVLALAGLWALRLAGYITWRHWGQPEDRRYRAIRARNEPHFELKSALPRVRPAGAARRGSSRCRCVAAVASTGAVARWLDALGLALRRRLRDRDGGRRPARALQGPTRPTAAA